MFSRRNAFIGWVALQLVRRRLRRSAAGGRSLLGRLGKVALLATAIAGAVAAARRATGRPGHDG